MRSEWAKEIGQGYISMRIDLAKIAQEDLPIMHNLSLLSGDTVLDIALDLKR